jgi:hypothetical protein
MKTIMDFVSYCSYDISAMSTIGFFQPSEKPIN